MRNLILILGIFGILLSLFAILNKKKRKEHLKDDEEIHFELYAQ